MISAHTLNAPLDPPDTRDAELAAERQATELADVKSVLFGLRAFREDAECDASEDDLARMHEALDADDVLEAHHIRVAIWDAHADSWITTHTESGLRQRIAAAHIAKRQFQRDEAQMFPLRSAGTAPFGAALPGSAPAERPLSLPRTGASSDAPSPAAGLSSDTRAAA